MSSHPARPLPWLPWIASGLFVIGVLAALITAVTAMASDQSGGLRLTVVDEDTGQALEDASVLINGTAVTIDDDGNVAIDDVDGPMNILIGHDGYRSKVGDLSVPADSATWKVALRPSASSEIALASTSTNVSGESRVQVAASPPSSDIFTPVAGTAVSAIPTVAATPIAQGLSSPVPAASGSLSGTIVDADGNPVQGAVITDGQTVQVTGADGVYAVDAETMRTESLRVTASGYADRVVSFSDPEGAKSVELALQPVKALYYNPNISNTQADVDRLVELINTTEANAIVIDVKEELVFYDSNVEFFNDVGTIEPILDLPALLSRMQEHGIYTIARHVVFKDSLVAERRSHLAVTHNVTGEVWRDMNGVAWVNPMIHTLWDANIELAVELADLGFDEIQYDYVRFPTDGDLSTMDFGLEFNEENRVAAISKFLEQSHNALRPTGAKLSADVFGFTALVPDDLGIGQDITELAPYLDYISPMVYPSHFPDGSMGLEGQPNNFPYETIELSMSAGKSQLGSALQLRPWLQDFDYWDMIPYGVKEVRAQIDAANDVGTSGWMLWDPDNVYTAGALGPDGGNMKRYREPTAALTVTATPAASRRRVQLTPVAPSR